MWLGIKTFFSVVTYIVMGVFRNVCILKRSIVLHYIGRMDHRNASGRLCVVKLSLNLDPHPKPGGG